MASALWSDPYETLGVAREGQLSTIHLTYRLRLRSHIRKLYKDPTKNADTQRAFQRIQEAYDILVKKNELNQSIKALMGGEIYQLVECWKILLRATTPTISDEIQRGEDRYDVPTRKRSSELWRNPNQLVGLPYRVQPGWLIGIASCIQLLFDLVSMIMTLVQRSYSRHDYRQLKPTAELYGVTIEKDLQRIDVQIPLILSGQRIMATLNLGSDYNFISASLAEQLELNFPISGFTKRFRLANGHDIWRKAIVWARSSIPSEKTADLNLEFHVLEPLAIPIMVGREFLKKMDILTTYLDRLVRAPYPHGVSSSLPQILHLTAPRQRLHCFIASIPAEANIDTGATINLASPEFAARSGLQIEPTDQQHQSVQLADGSITSISGCIHARFNPFDQPSTTGLLPKAHVKKFYILDGLTSDVLIGRDLLLEMYAFADLVDQTNVFSKRKRQGVYDDLAVIAWMEEWRTTSGLHSCQQKSLEVKHSTFWCDGIVHHLNERERLPIQPHLKKSETKVRERIRHKQELYLRKRKQAAEAKTDIELPVLESQERKPKPPPDDCVLELEWRG